MMNETILTILFVVGVTLFFTYKSYRQKQDSWEGVVVNKKENYDDESGMTTYYLFFKTNAGKKKVNLSSARSEYGKWNIGDKGTKRSGSYLPEKNS